MSANAEDKSQLIAVLASCCQVIQLVAETKCPDFALQMRAEVYAFVRGIMADSELVEQITSDLTSNDADEKASTQSEDEEEKVEPASQEA